MVRRGRRRGTAVIRDINSDDMSCTGDRVVPQGHSAVAEEDSIAARQCRVVVGDRKPGDRRSGTGLHRCAGAGRERRYLSPAYDGGVASSYSSNSGTTIGKVSPLFRVSYTPGFA